jgi:response regulator NasT
MSDLEHNTNEDAIRVLVADDEPLIRMDLKEMLEETPYYTVVGEAKDGLEAYELAKRLDPDVIFMDIMMPQMTGIEAARKLRETLNRRIPIIMLTAYSQRELYEEASEAGVFGYLTKPLRKADLGPAVEIAISRAIELEDLSDEVKSLADKLETRKLIEKAKGALMRETGIDEANAYRIMQKRAMDQRTSLKAVAEAVLTKVK